MKLELRRHTVPSPRAANAQQRWPERQSLLLRICDAQGHAGVGEASPLPGYSPDSLEDVERALHSVRSDDIARALAAGAISAVLNAASELLPATLPSGRLALETALLDLVGQQERCAAPVLLGAEPAAERPVAELVGSPLAGAFTSACERAVASGFRQLKVKLGVPGQLDAELVALQTAGARLGKAARFRVDANRALSPRQIERAWAVLEPLGIELFEEPGVLDPSLPPTLPLALDESLQRLDISAALGRLQATNARFAVLKPSALGGIAHCRQLAESARAAGVQAVISHCFEGPLAFRAAAALALALPPDVAHGLAPHAGLDGWPHPAPPFERGWLKAWSAPGLGFAPGGFFE